MILGHRLQPDSPDEAAPGVIRREKEGGDIIVLGRNTFKEVVRGIHEGYLLPLDYVPPIPPEEPKKEEGQQQQPPPPPPIVERRPKLARAADAAPKAAPRPIGGSPGVKPAAINLQRKATQWTFIS